MNNKNKQIHRINFVSIILLSMFVLTACGGGSSGEENKAPVAEANGPYTGSQGSTIDFTSTGSNDSDGSIASYSWDFGDGNSSTGANPSHIYTGSGSFNITLTVTDNDSKTSSDTASVDVLPVTTNATPTANINAPGTGITGAAVSFSGSGSSDSDGNIVSYSWDFGDGSTSTNANPDHTYTGTGIYTVTLTVTDDNGASATTSFEVEIVIPTPGNQVPTANVNGPYTGTTGVTMSFSSAGSSDPDGTVNAYSWDFGDGATSNAQYPSHTYTSASTYNVSLIVTDDDGADSAAATTTATITDPVNIAPTANVNGTYTGTTGVAVSFSSDGSSDPDGTVNAYSWDFGDGATSNAQTPSHTYTSASTYNVSLIVTDNDGADSAAATTTATITDPVNIAPTANVNGTYTGTTVVAVSFSSAGSSDPDGTVTAYSWDFGDGATSNAQYPSHTYASAGTYNVSLVVTDNDGANSTAATTTATISDPANVAPTANVNGTYTGTTGVAMSFSSAGSSDPDGTVNAYSWSFGDGATSSAQTPTHTYASASTYNVSLIVTDDDGADSAAATTTATITDAGISLSVQANGPYFGSTGAAVSFSSAGTVTSSGVITSYLWDFGDGNSSSDPSPMHSYSAADSYSVTLTVSNNQGSTVVDTTSAIIQTISSDSINSTSHDGSISTTSVALQSFTGNSSYKIFGTNDLGMHCGDFDTRISSILPPFNVLHAQVIQMGSTPGILTINDGISVYYTASANSNDPILSGVNSSGDGDVLSSIANNGQIFKTNFWDTASTNVVEPTALSAYRAFYPPGILDAFYPNGGRDVSDNINIKGLGLPMPNVEQLYLGDGQLTATQQDMPGRSDPYAINTPQEFPIFSTDQPFFINFAFGYTSLDVNWFEAAGIPLTAFDDSGRENPWPLYRLQAKNTATGNVLASTDVVVPISGEANCGFCHNASIDGGNGSATKDLEDNNIAVATVLDDPEFDVSVPLAVSKEYAADLNILRLHDLKHSTNLESSTPVVCQTCHYTPALDLAHVGPMGPENEATAGAANGRDQAKNKSMSNVMHSHHATVRDLNGDLLFVDMPPAVDNNGNARDPAVTKTILDETCYQCHPGRRTDCLRGAMANGGMVCQDCHGQIAQVGNDFSRTVGPDSIGSFELADDFYDHTNSTPRVPWANEPGCGSCHTGDVRDNMNGNSDTLASAKTSDTIRLVQAFRIGDNKATPIVPTNKRFAENTVAGTNNPMLYRVSKGHGGVFCEACHGATHGIWPNKNPTSNDNVTATQLQGHTGTIIECSTCHGSANLGNTLSGPHGMHAVGETNFADGGHKNLGENSPNSCRTCHGNNGEGTVLSRTAQARDFRGMKNGGQVSKGHQVTCHDCHQNEL